MTSELGCILFSVSPRSSMFTASRSRPSSKWSVHNARAMAEDRLLPCSQWIAISGGSAFGPSKNPSTSITCLPNSIASVICAILGPTKESSALAPGGLGERNGEIAFD
jgi:hypothetical protein